MDLLAGIRGWALRWRDEDEDTAGRNLFRYHRLWLVGVAASCLVSLIPLVIMFLINYYQYQQAFSEEVIHPIRMTVSNMHRTLRFYLEERQAALGYVIRDRRFEDLTDQEILGRVFANMKRTYSGLVDLGLIDARGVQRSYAGPYRLKDRDYRSQSWFRETLQKGAHISDVFLGYRKYPHFAIAVRSKRADGTPYVLRATLDAAIFSRLMKGAALHDTWDTFIVNRKGVLQTPSKTYGRVLRRIQSRMPPPSGKTEVIEEDSAGGGVQVTGYVDIERSPYVFMVVEQRRTLLRSWFSLRNKLVLFLVISVLMIVVVILAGATYMINRLREVDTRRVALLHQVEYTSKMASIGRLASGVAHEINNPLAIINEKAGLLRDIMELGGDFPLKERLLGHVGPIQRSVVRCSRITRRLLRFARHMDVKVETIDLEELIGEVLGFLDKESHYRSLTVRVDAGEGIPAIHSDRGRLQQVFLNIVNNAFAAVEDGGRVDITVTRAGEDSVCVIIRDDGAGISEENLSKVFEPFFTTKEKHGTGLGLSITYGIVTKLGGRILVDSHHGQWTEFSVILPVKRPLKGDRDEQDTRTAG